MAIAYDNSSWSTVHSSVTSFSWTLTIGSLTNGGLYVCCGLPYPNDIVTSVTCGGNSMTRVLAQQAHGSPGRWMYVYFLANPPSGSQTITVSSGSNTMDAALGIAVSYSGVRQNPVYSGGGQTDVATGFLSSSSPYSSTITTIADNSWVALYAFGSDQGAGSISSMGGTTRGTTPQANNKYSDSNGVIHPAGSTSLSCSWVGASLCTIMFSISPYTAPVVNSNFLAFM